MKYKCIECFKIDDKESPCYLDSMDEDFKPEYCPFDNKNITAVWVKIPVDKKSESEK